jgi:methyl-accepting chemotaxis protein
LAGVDQVAMAMAGIKQASSQNVDSSKQLESATQNLSDLGQRLQKLVERYRM